MATKKKQTEWHYVLVMTEEGPKFVTKLGEHHYAHWDKLESPLELSESMAKDMVIGLTWNGNVAYHVVSPFALDHQPFFYSKGQFEWKYNEETK